MNLSPLRGVLIVGVQGCGKSLAAKVIAREWGCRGSNSTPDGSTTSTSVRRRNTSGARWTWPAPCAGGALDRRDREGVWRERRAILGIHLGLRNQRPGDFDVARLSVAADGFSGAEIEQAVIATAYRALYDKRRLDTDLLLAELDATVPLSVSRREDIERLRATAEGRFVPVR